MSPRPREVSKETVDFDLTKGSWVKVSLGLEPSRLCGGLTDLWACVRLQIENATENIPCVRYTAGVSVEVESQSSECMIWRVPSTLLGTKACGRLGHTFANVEAVIRSESYTD